MALILVDEWTNLYGKNYSEEDWRILTSMRIASMKAEDEIQRERTIAMFESRLEFDRIE